MVLLAPVVPIIVVSVEVAPVPVSTVVGTVMLDDGVLLELPVCIVAVDGEAALVTVS